MARLNTIKTFKQSALFGETPARAVKTRNIKVINVLFKNGRNARANGVIL